MLHQPAFDVGKQTAVKNQWRALLAQQKEESQKEVERVENFFTDKGMKILPGLALPEIGQAGGCHASDLCPSRGPDQRDKRFGQGVGGEDARSAARPDRSWI